VPSTVLEWPAAASGNYISPDPENGYSYNRCSWKLDHKIKTKTTFPHTGLWDKQPGGASWHQFLYYYEVAPIHVQNYVVVLQSTFSPRLSNQLTAGVNYFNQVFFDFNNGIDPKASGLFLSPSTDVLGAPNLRISGFDQTGRLHRLAATT